MKTKPTVSIITVNYNGLEETLGLLESLKMLNISDLEVVVVDNASKVNPKYEINAEYPGVKVILSDHNLGFAGGNNLGMNAASGEYYFFLNNDTVLTKDIISPMVKLLQDNASIGVLCPVINEYYSPNTIQYAGFTEINPLTGRNKLLTIPEDTSSPYYTAYPHGAAMMIRKSVVDLVGNMPEEYFLYYEELDWAAQIKRAGYSIMVDPRRVVYHKESSSVGLTSPLKTFYHTRNRLLFMRRNYKGLSLLTFLAFFYLVVVAKSFALLTIRSEKKHIKAFKNGLWWSTLPTFSAAKQVRSTTVLNTTLTTAS